jgi:hypothetical protein
MHSYHHILLHIGWEYENFRYRSSDTWYGNKKPGSTPGFCYLETLLPPGKVRKGAVGLGHFVGVFFLFVSGASLVNGIYHFGSQALGNW